MRTYQLHDTIRVKIEEGERERERERSVCFDAHTHTSMRGCVHLSLCMYVSVIGLSVYRCVFANRGTADDMHLGDTSSRGAAVCGQRDSTHRRKSCSEW